MTNKRNNFNPIFIIGAPRSGTNILRDTLSSLKNIGTWDCDEIPYIWRYGNKSFETDFFTKNMANSKVSTYIIKQFTKISKKQKVKYVLEKTCANSLRVDFINEIFPKAKFIYILRNGLDVTYSIMKRWNSNFSLSYTYKKIKHVPVMDILYYTKTFLKNRIYKLRKKNRLKFWGPRFAKSKEISNLSLEQIVAMQWVSCIDSSNRAFRKMDSNRYMTLKYEDFVSNPDEIIKDIVKFIGCEFELKSPLPIVRSSSIGKGIKNLSLNQVEVINTIIEKTMLENEFK